MDQEYTTMVEKYCRIAHTDRVDEDTYESRAERRKALKKQYEPIFDYQKKKQMEVYGESELTGFCRAELTDIQNALEHKQVNEMGYHKWFKDQADFLQWKQVLEDVEHCESTGGSFLVSRNCKSNNYATLFSTVS